MEGYGGYVFRAVRKLLILERETGIRTRDVQLGKLGGLLARLNLP